MIHLEYTTLNSGSGKYGFLMQMIDVRLDKLQTRFFYNVGNMWNRKYDAKI